MSDTPKVVQMLEVSPSPQYPGYTVVLYSDGAMFEKMMAVDAKWERVALPEREPAPDAPPPVNVEELEDAAFKRGVRAVCAQLRRTHERPAMGRVLSLAHLADEIERALEAQ